MIEEAEKIIQQVREEITDRGYDEITSDYNLCIKKHVKILGSGAHYDQKECDRLLFCQTKMWNNKIGHPRRTGIHLIDSIMGFAGKIIGFIINSWVDSQNEFNANVVSMEYQFYDHIRQMEKRIKDLEKKIQELENNR